MEISPAYLLYLGLLRYQVDFAAQEADFSDDDFDLDDYWNGFYIFEHFYKLIFWKYVKSF